MLISAKAVILKLAIKGGINRCFYGCPRCNRAFTALPGDRPAAALHADIIGALTGQEDQRRIFANGQDVVIILEQYHRFCHRFPGQFPVRLTPHQFKQPGVRQRAFK